MIGTKNTQVANNTISPYITYGVGEYKINSLEIKTASTGAMKVMLNMESRPVTGNFTPDSSATVSGKVGTVNLTSYMNPNNDSFAKSVEIFQQKIAQIADVLSVREQLDMIEADTIEKYVSLISPLLTNKWAFWCISAEEYMGQDKDGNAKVKFTLHIPRYQFVSATDSLNFDKTKAYHYKKLEVTKEEFSPQDNDAEW